MQNYYNLLIIYVDGTEHVITDVNKHELSESNKCFEYRKNGYRSFVPVDAVRFFGTEFGYKN